MATSQGESEITPRHCHNCYFVFLSNNNVCTICGSHNVEEVVSVQIIGDLNLMTPLRLFNAFNQPLESEGPQPAEQHQVDSLPNLILIGANDLSREAQCAICKEAFQEKDHARRLPCSHLFHHDCIIQWLRVADSCPICLNRLDKGKVASDAGTDSS